MTKKSVPYIEELRRIMKEKGVTIEALANSIGLTRGGFIQAERNDSFKMRDIYKMCVELEIEINDLFPRNQKNLASEIQIGYGLSERELLEMIAFYVVEIRKELKKKPK